MARAAFTQKRPRGSPTGITPLQDLKRPSALSRQRDGTHVSKKKLAFSETTSRHQWSELEDCALVEFILLTRPGPSWPFEKGLEFWDGAAKYIHRRSGSHLQRTGVYKC